MLIDLKIISDGIARLRDGVSENGRFRWDREWRPWFWKMEDFGPIFSVILTAISTLTRYAELARLLLITKMK